MMMMPFICSFRNKNYGLVQGVRFGTNKAATALWKGGGDACSHMRRRRMHACHMRRRIHTSKAATALWKGVEQKRPRTIRRLRANFAAIVLD